MSSPSSSRSYEKPGLFIHVSHNIYLDREARDSFGGYKDSVGTRSNIDTWAVWARLRILQYSRVRLI